MSINYPRWVFKAGSTYGVPGYMYDSLLVHDDESHGKALKDKWFPSVNEALANAKEDLDDLLGAPEEDKKEVEKPKVNRQRKEV